MLEYLAFQTSKIVSRTFDLIEIEIYSHQMLRTGKRKVGQWLPSYSWDKDIPMFYAAG